MRGVLIGAVVIIVQLLGLWRAVLVFHAAAPGALGALIRRKKIAPEESGRRRFGLVAGFTTAQLRQLNQPPHDHDSASELPFNHLCHAVGKFSLATDGRGPSLRRPSVPRLRCSGAWGLGNCSAMPAGRPPFGGRSRRASPPAAGSPPRCSLRPARAFQQRVWRALQEIPFGQTRSYGQLAALLRSWPRAVGRAISAGIGLSAHPCQPGRTARIDR